MSRPRIAVFSGPKATIQNSEPLVTSNKARQKYGLPPRTNEDGSHVRFDVLRPQRLAAPVTVYVEQYSAHPLERDVQELYAPPDGYVDGQGVFHQERRDPADVPVYEITLRPDDGLLPLPYMGRQADGQPWDDDCAHPLAPTASASAIAASAICCLRRPTSTSTAPRHPADTPADCRPRSAPTWGRETSRPSVWVRTSFRIGLAICPSTPPTRRWPA